MNNTIKTFKDWMESSCNTLNEFVKPGDIVDEEMYNHFLNIMPPLIFSSTLLQVSEPCDYLQGGNTYITFQKENGNWIYKGECHKNKTQNIMRGVN